MDSIDTLTVTEVADDEDQINAIDYPPDALVTVHCARCPLDVSFSPTVAGDAVLQASEHGAAVHNATTPWVEGDDWWIVNEGDIEALHSVRE